MTWTQELGHTELAEDNKLGGVIDSLGTREAWRVILIIRVMDKQSHETEQQPVLDSIPGTV